MSVDSVSLNHMSLLKSKPHCEELVLVEGREGGGGGGGPPEERQILCE